MKLPIEPLVIIGALLFLIKSAAALDSPLVSRANNAMSAVFTKQGAPQNPCTCIEEYGDAYYGSTDPEFPVICRTPYGCCAYTNTEDDKRASVSIEHWIWHNKSCISCVADFSLRYFFVMRSMPSLRSVRRYASMVASERICTAQIIATIPERERAVMTRLSPSELPQHLPCCSRACLRLGRDCSAIGDRIGCLISAQCAVSFGDQSQVLPTVGTIIEQIFYDVL